MLFTILWMFLFPMDIQVGWLLQTNRVELIHIYHKILFSGFFFLLFRPSHGHPAYLFMSLHLQ